MALIDMSEIFQMTNDGDHIDGTDVYQSNRNLLDNPWFTVNQRGFTSGSPSAGYTTFDRWKVLGGTATYTKRSPYGITINCSADYVYDQIVAVEKAVILGKTVTASVMIDGVVYSGTGVVTNESYSVTVNAGIVKIRLGIFNAINTTYPFFRISGNSPWGTANIDAVKLELGSVSTLANDAPPDYGEELAKCKYYFRRITNIGRGRLFIGVGFSGGVEVPNIFGVGNEMRKTTSLAVTYSGSFVVSAGTDIAVTNISKNENNSNFGLSFTASGITPYALYSILGSAGAYIDISADL